MAPAPATAALALVAFLVLVAGAWCWLIAAAKAVIRSNLCGESASNRLSALLASQGIAARLPLIAWSPRRPAPWSFLDLVAIVGLYIVAGAALHGSGLVPSGEIETLSLAEMQTVIAANTLLSLGVAVVSVLLVMVRCGATSGDLGWSWHDVRADLRLGLIGFVMLAPPVYALQGLLVSFWKESKHPVMEMFQAEPYAAFFLALLVSATIIAPLFEELLFRVLLQGFLEKVVTFRGDPIELIVGYQRQRNDSAPPPAELPPSDNPYAPPQELLAASQAMAAEFNADQPELRGILAWLPIGVSTAIFALLHYSHGPDWIPLLLLAAGMGYLYQRTHRLLPSLVVHALLNAMSMWGLWVGVKEGLSP